MSIVQSNGVAAIDQERVESFCSQCEWLCNAYLGFFLFECVQSDEILFSVSVIKSYVKFVYTSLCVSVLDVYMSVKSQHLRLVDDVSEFHHTVWRSGSLWL